MSGASRGRPLLGRDTQASDLSAISRNAAQLAVTRSIPNESYSKDTLEESRATPLATRMPRMDRPLASADSALAISRSSTPGQGETFKPPSSTDSTPIARTCSLVGLFEQKSSSNNLPHTPKKPEGDIYHQPKSDTNYSERRSRTSIGDTFSIKDRGSLPESVRNTHSFDATVLVPPQDRPEGPSLAKVVELAASPSTKYDMLPRNSDTFKLLTPKPVESASHPPSTRDLLLTKPMPNQTGSYGNPPGIGDAPPSNKSITAQYNQMYPQRLTPLSTGEELADAIVASSIASSRRPSPRRLEPPPPPSRRSKVSSLPFSRTPSPAKHTMLQTLRKVDASDVEESNDERHPYRKHKKKRLVRKHPNKHHEGDRKRWRDAVTERERKRYDGVWAANRGLYCALVPPHDEKSINRSIALSGRGELFERVSNLVVRDIWCRSRLPDSVLEDIWDLVDSDGIGRLTKDEFVVGLWLIDQRLKGRKLPVKVSNSVWTSVRSLQGIKIRP